MLNLDGRNISQPGEPSDSGKNSGYWQELVSASVSYIFFYNVRERRRHSVRAARDPASVSGFLKRQNCSLLDLYGSIAALYLARVSMRAGCLLYTRIPDGKAGTPGKRTLLKAEFSREDRFTDLLGKFQAAYREAVLHTDMDVDHYLKEKATYFSVYDLSCRPGGASAEDDDGSVLSFRIREDTLELLYDPEFFTDAFMRRMAKNFESLTDAVLREPDQALAGLEIVSAEERDLISAFSRGRTIPVDRDRLLPQAFREHAAADPDLLAVDDGVNRISYGEMERISNSVANDLYRNHGIGPGSRVALMMPRNYHFPELCLALNKIGAVYIPVDTRFPETRIAHMIRIAQADHLITVRSIAETLTLAVDVICMEDLDEESDETAEIRCRGDDLMAVFFTSGTTGMPKGVKFSNRQAPFMGRIYSDIFHPSRGDVFGSLVSFSFVASFLVQGALYHGCTLRLFNEEELKNGLVLIKTLKEMHMHSIIMPPGIGIPVYESGDLKLDYMIVVGSNLNGFTQREGHTRLANMYGMTECIYASVKIFDPADIRDGRASVGKPVPNGWVYVLDADNHRMPVGVPGEICVAGPLCSTGYYHDPELTSSRFVPNPFSDCELNRIMYRTGDTGFFNEDGEIEFTGRTDDQMSVRGFRIEPNEITGIMKRFPEIRDIYLDVEKDVLTAYYVTGEELDPDLIRKALEKELPYYMIPSLFVRLEKIPLSMNGKIDKVQLKSILRRHEKAEIADETVRAVAEAFMEILGLDSVLPDDGFVELGGDSLSAMRLQLLLSEKLSVTLSAGELISLSTPENIAAYIKSGLHVYSSAELDRYSFDRPCPLTESQLNVYLDESAHGKGTAYNNPFRIRFADSERYTPERIRNALRKLTEVFPVLKGRVVNRDGALSMVFDAEPEITEGSPDDAAAFVRPFETNRCLARFRIAADGAATVLCADLHHLIFDGASLNVLLNALFSVLNGEEPGFADRGVLRTAALEELRASENTAEAEAYYDRMLAERDEAYGLIPSPDGEADPSGYIHPFETDAEQVNAFLRGRSVTPNQFFAAVFAYTLSRFTGSEKVLFNLIADGRGHIDLSRSVGMFVRTLPVLADCRDRETGAFLAASAETIGSVMKYDAVPFRRLAGKYGLANGICFQYSHAIFSDALNMKDRTYEIEGLPHDPDADLSFNVFNDGKRLSVRVLHSAMFSKDFITRFTRSYEMILRQIMQAGRLGDIRYISDQDTALLDRYNQTESPLEYGDILDAFNENLEQHPEYKLVEYNDYSCTYAEGARIADKIRRKLLDLGVKAQDRVAFLVPRSELYMFCTLGIVAMGGIFVPLDDALPDERIAFMIRDAAPGALIVSDETLRRAETLAAGGPVLLNVSDFMREEKGTLNRLPVMSGSLVCLLYTSGSTGFPKGVKITRKSLLNLSDSNARIMDIHPGDMCGLYASIGFDVSIGALFTAIYSGACLDIVPESVRLDVRALNRHFLAHHVTHIHITTQIARIFVSQIEETSLKVLVTGGEKLGQAVEERKYRFVDTYGPTEACVYVTAIGAKDKCDPCSEGYPIGNTKAYILDGERRRVPPGAVGELYLSGLPLAEGYLNREEETARAFPDNPFEKDEKYGKMYATGDMARMLPDGTYDILGRRDGQVKIRGNRVELTGVESVIRELDGVKGVAAKVIHMDGNNELAAYIVSDLDGDTLEKQVAETLHGRVPAYMIPSFVIRVDSIPVNVNGKVDKRALPDVDPGRLHDVYAAPRTETERLVVRGFEQTLRRERIGIHDDFVRLGGDSLAAVKLMAALGECGITVADILDLRTPAAIAAAIQEASSCSVPDLYTLESGCPLNNAQMFIYQDVVGKHKSDSYLIPSLIPVPGKYGKEQIMKALERVFAAYPVLSMKVVLKDGVPYMVKGHQPAVTRSSLNIVSSFRFLASAFDITDSLSRYMIVTLPGKSYLISIFHHLVFDIMSGNVFRRAFLRALDGDPLDYVDDKFLKVSAYQQQMRHTAEYDENERFARSMLRNIDDRGYYLTSGETGRSGFMTLDLEVDPERTEAFLKKYGTSRNILYTAAMACTLSALSGKADVGFGILENGRDRFNSFDALGLYLNGFPVLAHVDYQDMETFLKDLSGMYYRMVKNSFYPFCTITQKVIPGPVILFQYVPDWITEDGGYDDLPLNDRLIDRIIAGIGSFEMEADMEVVEKNGRCTLRILYSGYYSRKDIVTLAKAYQAALNRLIGTDSDGGNT